MTLHARGLACARGGRELFSAVDFELAAKEALWVRGRNGSGKTSLLRVVCGLAAPAGGEVRWRGHNVRRQPEDFHRGLLYIGHASAIKDDLTPTENILLGERLAGRAQDRRAVAKALDQIGLGPAAHRLVARLSQGQRKRVALARLYLQPAAALLVLDEPFNALDQHGTQLLCTALQQQLERGAVVVYTAHQVIELQAARLQVAERAVQLIHLGARLQVLDLDPNRPC